MGSGRSVRAAHLRFVGPSAFLQVQLDRHFAEGQMISQHPQQVAVIIVAEALGIATHQHDRRRLCRDLGRVVNLGTTILVQRWLMSLDGGLDQSIQNSGGNPFSRLLEQHGRVVQKRLDVLSCLASDERDRRVAERGKLASQGNAPSGRSLPCRATGPTC